MRMSPAGGSVGMWEGPGLDTGRGGADVEQDRPWRRWNVLGMTQELGEMDIWTSGGESAPPASAPPGIP